MSRVLAVISVFLSHSSKDKLFVRELAHHLEQHGDIKVWLDEREIAPGANIVGSIGDGLDSDFILLILSPDSVDSNWVKEEWTDAFWEQTNDRKTKLLGVLCRDCTIPRLLRNKKYFDLRTNQPQGFREIRTFLVTQKPVPVQRANYLPVRPPIFIGREVELAALREQLGQPGALVHIPGMPGRGKTTLALEFAHRFQPHFEAVYWLPCQSSSLPSIAAELARLLGLQLDGDLRLVIRELKGVCGAKRCLLILDNVDDETAGELVPGGVASVLVTTRLTNLRFLRHRHAVSLPLFTDQQCFELFRRQVGEEEVRRHEAECRQLFQRLGHLPIAISLAAALIHEDVRYTIAGMARDVPKDVTALVREAIDALAPAPRQLLEAMSACAREGFFLDLAAEVASLDDDEVLAALQQLTARSLAEEINRTDRRYRLHALVRETANNGRFGEQHADAVGRRFKRWETDWRWCEAALPDFQVALDWALGNDSVPSPDGLAYDGYRLTRRVGRLTEASAICERMHRVAEEGNRRSWLRVWLGCQALILQDRGQLDDALALHKKEEAICLELGDKNNLQISYGNQALILKAWGRLDEALALHKQQETICLELGYKDSLQASYGNQALILKGWGRLDEALALHKQQETICLELGNKDSLQRCYGYQASILKDWGRLDEALALHRQQETICLELGNKRDLGYCYWSWGLLERAFGNTDGERTKLSAALAIFEGLRMPRERDAVKAELGKV